MDSKEIKVGSKVRSFDFPHLEQYAEIGREACYVEGYVEEITEAIEGCARYRIRVTKQVFRGKDTTETAPRYVFPPLNGTRTLFGKTTDGVMAIK